MPAGKPATDFWRPAMALRMNSRIHHEAKEANRQPFVGVEVLGPRARARGCLLDEVEHGDAGGLVGPGDGDHEVEVGLDQAPAALGCGVGADRLGQLGLVSSGELRVLGDAGEVGVEQVIVGGLLRRPPEAEEAQEKVARGDLMVTEDDRRSERPLDGPPRLRFEGGSRAGTVPTGWGIDGCTSLSPAARATAPGPVPCRKMPRSRSAGVARRRPWR